MKKLLSTYRFWVMWVISLAVMGWFLWDDPNGGNQLLEQMKAPIGLLAVAPLVYILRRAFAEAVRGKDLAEQIRAGNIAAGIAYTGLCILTGLLFLAFAPRALASELPPGAIKHLPVLQDEISARWSSIPMRSVLGAQVEQESGWRERATLKTEREEGVGLGQFTRAYRADGSMRFDAMSDIIAQDRSLAGWSWADRYNPRMQLRAVVVKNRNTFAHIRRLVPDDANAMAMMDAAYNCGEGCVYARRRLCAKIAGCDPGRWFGHAELYSAQSKVKWKGYGQSAHDITNTHVRNVMVVRRPKYIRAMESTA